MRRIVFNCFVLASAGGLQQLTFTFQHYSAVLNMSFETSYLRARRTAAVSKVINLIMFAELGLGTLFVHNYSNKNVNQ